MGADSTFEQRIISSFRAIQLVIVLILFTHIFLAMNTLSFVMNHLVVPETFSSNKCMFTHFTLVFILAMTFHVPLQFPLHHEL